MGELYRIGALVISMRYKDNEQHHKPHVHAKYGEFEASVGVDGELLVGSLPLKQMKILTLNSSGARQNNCSTEVRRQWICIWIS